MDLSVNRPELFLCRVCGAANGHKRHIAREMMFGTREKFVYVECGRCHCLQVEAIPEDLGPYYPEGYYAHGGNLDDEFADPKRRHRAGRLIRWLLTAPEALARWVPWKDMRRPLWAMRHLKPKRQDSILDIGCGAGRLLYLLNLAGFPMTMGCDPVLAEPIQWRNGLRVENKPLKDIDGLWNIIMLHHSLEHIPDQIATLRHVRRLLAPGGYCLIRIPVSQSEAWKRYGVDWVQLDAPRHLYLHTWESLQRTAEAADMIIERVTCDSYSLQFWGSEQYRDDIPLNDPRSWRWGHGAPRFSAAQIAAWERESESLNAAGQGDQAAFILRAAEDAA